MAAETLVEDSTAEEETARRNDRAVKRTIVDCDVHPVLPEGLKSVLPYLSESWQERFRSRAAAQHTTGFEGGYQHPLVFLKADATPPSGAAPGSDPEFMRKDLLDRLGVDRALLVHLSSINGWVDPDEAAVIASAFNDYFLEHWLPLDERFRLAMTVSALDPDAAAAEIRRVGGSDGVAAVYMPLPNILMGQRHYYPIYEAAQELELPIVYHATAMEAIYPNAPQLAGGTPTSYPERFVTLPQLAESQVASLIWDGALERFPNLKFVFAEVGWAWVPHILWRLESAWKSFRFDRPWVKRSPVEYVLNSIRFTTQPYVEAPKQEYVAQILEMMHADRTLLFSTDYPHWDGDDPDLVVRRVRQQGSDELAERVFSQTARETFPRIGL